MYEPLPRMTRHLGSRATQVSDMTEALYWAIDGAGLRLPPRREVARRARVSEATISRRFRESRSNEENLVTRLVNARRHTHPRGYLEDGWARWLPAEDVDLQDVRVWLSCLALAAYSPAVAEVVRDAWDDERERLASDLGPTDDCDARAELVQAVLVGLSIRCALDPEMSHERAVALLERAAGALA